MGWEGRVDKLPYLGFRMAERRGQAFFKDIRESIRTSVQKYIPPVTSIILTGTAASHQQFIDTVKDARTIENFDAHVRMTSDIDFVFATAKGAAEIAKRRQEGRVRCEWSEECKKNLAQLQSYTDIERFEL